MANDNKIDRLLIPCTVPYKKKLKAIAKRQETSVADFTRAAINEKIKRDGLGDE